MILDGGRVIERGDHAALVARGGLYARLWRLHERPATGSALRAVVGD